MEEARKERKQELTEEEIKEIDLIPKWWPINYSFVCMLVSPLRLIFTSNSFVFYTCRRGEEG